MERADARIARINGAADKMHRMLAELLDLSRSGRLVGPKEEIQLGRLAREAVELVAGTTARVAAEVIIAPDLPMVYGDRTRLLEVLHNLIDNGFKFSAENASPTVEIGTRGEGDETVIFVRDNGIGIDPRYRHKIFGLFEKLDRDTEGSGVGLAIVKRIIEVHGGRIWVETEGLDKGSAFCFTLPPKKKEAV
jgi:signal transduction histidine kinase